jgi:hypothetical protein
MANDNRAWQLEDFVDSLVVELDKTRETLAVKTVNKPLSYTVKDVALDLNIFPTYDGDNVRFVTAQPGEQGSSKVTINLGSITDQQVRATSKTPTHKNDVLLDQINVDPQTKKQLKKYGINSADDLKQIEEKNIDIQKVSDNTIDYSSIANKIQQARRAQVPPRVSSVSLSKGESGIPTLLVRGENLSVHPSFRPVAVMNQKLADVRSASANEMRIELSREHSISDINELILTCDPFAVVKMNVKL